jgi:hypothetical protein
MPPEQPGNPDAGRGAGRPTAAQAAAEARQAADRATAAAAEARELVTEIKDLAQEIRGLAARLTASSTVGAGRSEPEPSTDDQPGWMRDGPSRLPHELRVEKIKPALGWQLERFWELPEEQQLTLYWAMRLMDAAEQQGIPRRIPGFRYLRSGFLDPAEGANEIADFGLKVVAAPIESGTDAPPADLPPLTVDGHRFPVIVEHPVEIVHGPAVLPTTGSTGCWAYSRVSTGRRGPGLLTAKHVVDQALDGRVAMSDGHFATVVDMAPDGVDAALVSSGEPVGVTRLEVQQLVAPWTDVEFVGARSVIPRTKVKDITDTRGIYSTSLLPVRVFLGAYGARGDSGALIREVSTGRAIGVYMGELRDCVGTVEGFAQHMYQVQLLMDLELYT